tara:strand:+ start:21971 stop:22963 length:993 start_codon:yes stop_codon:yes gene_type:complete
LTGRGGLCKLGVMAVFTTLDSHDIDAFLQDYDLGKLERFEGILSGVENTNYHIFTDKGRYVLTVHEGKVAEADLPFFLGYIQHLSDRHIPTCTTIANKSGALYGFVKSKTATISAFLEGAGTTLDDITPDQCIQLGRMLGKMHVEGRSFPLKRPNQMGLDQWRALWLKTHAQADRVLTGQSAFVNEELELIAAHFATLNLRDLPAGPTHCDLFPDNVFFDGGQLSGIIDFYYACNEYFIYDLALSVNAWCFDGDTNYVEARFQALITGYSAIRALTADEVSVFNIMLRASALRIQMTRLYDYLNHSDDHHVSPHDPTAFIKRIMLWKEPV